MTGAPCLSRKPRQSCKSISYIKIITGTIADSSFRAYPHSSQALLGSYKQPRNYLPTPIPLRRRMAKKQFSAGDLVRITRGVFASFVGTVIRVDDLTERLTVLVQNEGQPDSEQGTLNISALLVEKLSENVSVTPLKGLSPRQTRVLQLIAKGKTTKQIALELNISVKTVEAHRMQLMDRLLIHDVPGLVRFAIRAGLVALED